LENEVDENRFFKWTGRVNSILFLLLLVLSIGFVIYGFISSNNWRNRNAVEVTDLGNAVEDIEGFRLSDISIVCGKDIQYVKLNSQAKSKGFSSGSGYHNVTRNLVFFVGRDMNSHWLFDSNMFLIRKIDQLQKNANDCKEKETVSIYYEISKSDTNSNGKLDEDDAITIGLSNPDGLNFSEVETGITSVIDHSIDSVASVLTVLMQKGSALIMKKYSLETYKMISEKEITKISKKL
jgi:hypothetical protein